MRLSLALALMLPVSGCVSAANEPIGELPALCDDTYQLRTDHAAALADDGGDRSVVTGAALLSRTDGACEPYDLRTGAH